MANDPTEPIGDLGYDTVHQDLAGEGTGGPPGPAGGTPEPGGAGVRGDADGDLGYDEAHDFRR